MSAAAPFRVPGYRPLLASYSINETGDAVGLIALSVLIFDRTESPMVLVAFFVCARVLPALLAPLLTARLDQLPVRRSLPLLYALEALCFVGLALLVEDLSLPLVLLLALADGALALAGRGISRGAVASITQAAGVLREGNALVNVAFGVASVVGLAAGGLIVGASTVEVALYVDAASFAIVAAGLALTRSLPPGTHEESREAFTTRLRAGLALARHDRLIGPLVLWQGAAFVFFYLVIPIEVVYVEETLGASAGVLGAMLACWSGGILVGSLVYVRLRRVDTLMLVVLATAAVAAGYVGIGLSRTVFLACAFSVVGGLGNGFQFVAVLTLAQDRTPADYQARITGLLESVGAATPAIGFLIGGALASLASPALAYLVAGVGVLLLALLAATRGRALLGSDLDDDGDDHRPPLDPVVHERGEVVVE